MSNENKFGRKVLVSSFALACPPALFAPIMTAAAAALTNEPEGTKEDEIILKSAKLPETEKLKDEQLISNTKYLLKKARELANQKFALTINKDHLNKLDSPVGNKIVLKGEESPAWHGQLIKIKLKRTVEPLSKKKTITSTSTNNKPANNSVTAPASRSLFEYYKKVRGEYEDFKEIEAVRLQKRLEKLSDYPTNSKKTFEGNKNMPCV